METMMWNLNNAVLQLSRKLEDAERGRDAGEALFVIRQALREAHEAGYDAGYVGAGLDASAAQDRTFPANDAN